MFNQKRFKFTFLAFSISIVYLEICTLIFKLVLSLDFVVLVFQQDDEDDAIIVANQMMM